MPLLSPEFLDLTPHLDLEAFWAENELCDVFSTNKPRCALSFSPDDHWLFEFIPPESTVRYYRDKTYRDSLHTEANRWLAEYVGRTYFDEDTWETSPKRIENLFGAEFAYHEDSTPWFVPAVDDPAAFARLLDKAEATDLETWVFPDDYLIEWERRKSEGKPLPKLGGGSRGPATVMTSVLPVETLFYWFIDHPELMGRFRDLLRDKMVELNQVLRGFSGNEQPGWYILDDNCALFNQRLYKEYCYPVLEHVLETLAPGDARRYQHSDSAMAHLIDMQYELGIRAVNYGPTVDPGVIRQKMPDAVIHGQIPPFTLRNGTPEEIRLRVVSDFEKAGTEGGLVITTAGSLAAGTGLGRMRWLMQVVQDETRYNG